MSKIHLGKTATSRSRRKQVVKDVPNDIKLPQDDFVNYLLSKNYSNTSIVTFTKDVRRFKVWLEKENIEIESVNYNDITSYLQSFGNVTQKTKCCYLRAVSMYFDFLVQQDDRTENPAQFIQLKGVKRRTLYDILSRQELDTLYDSYTLPDEQGKDKNQNWFKAQVLAQKRNKVILGLMLYQGLDTRSLKLLKVDDLKLRDGLLYIPSTRKTNERLLKLESMQILDLMEYTSKTRGELLQLTGKQSDRLFISIGSSDKFNSIMAYLVKRLRRINKKVTCSQQLRTSVFVHWLKMYNLRQVQYMAGHRYISSTESILVNEMDEMTEDIEKYHPIG